MQRLVSNFFVKAPPQLGFMKKGIPINPDILQKVSLGLTKQLKQSCSTYVDGLIDMDEQFLNNTTSQYLFNIIQPQMKQLQLDNNLDNSPQRKFASELQIDPNSQQSNKHLSKFAMKIYPFVVFGAKLQQRMRSHPLQNVIQMTRNRFLYKNFSEGFSGFVNSVYLNHIYGFKCEFKTMQKLGRNIMITLEGDIQKKIYYVTDLNNQLGSGQNKE